MTKILFFAVVVVVFISCNDDKKSSDYKFEAKEFKTFALDGQSKIFLKGYDGNIKTTGSDTAEFITMNVTKRVKSSISNEDAQSNVSNVNIGFDLQSDQLMVMVTQPVNDNRDYEVDFEIIHPEVFNYYLELGNGNVDLMTKSAAVTVQLGNGNLQADLRLLNSCQVNLNSGNGSVILSIPKTTNANISAEVGNGLITKTGLTMQITEQTKTKLIGTLGNGSGHISMNVGNGNIDLMAR